MYDLKLFLLAHKCFYQIPPQNCPEIFLKSATAVIIYEESLRLKYLFPRQSYFASPYLLQSTNATLRPFRFIREKISRDLNKMQLQLSRESHKENNKIFYFDSFQRTLIEMSVSK